MVKEIIYTDGDDIPEGKEIGDIKTAGDRLTNHNSSSITFSAESGLRTFEYNDLNDETENIILPGLSSDEVNL